MAEAVFDLLDTIKRKHHALTVTSNLGLADLRPVIGDAAVARLDRICAKVSI